MVTRRVLRWSALAAALVLRAPAYAHAAGAELTIEAPAVLLLGVDTGALVRFRAPAELQAALFTNVGSLSAPSQLPDGTWQAHYTPPATRYPQLAIVALVSRDGTQFAWTRIALQGAATVELRSDPSVRVSVKVAERVFGPQTTDASGRAALAVVVPPGVDTAVSSAIDALGNERNEVISLAVPKTFPLLGVCPADDARDFLVFAASAAGAPASGLALDAHATTVRLGELTRDTPGVYRAAFTIPAEIRAGEIARFSVAPRARESAAVSCELAVPLERPDRVELSLSRASHVASEREPIRVRVTPHYPGAREPAAAALAFTVSVGRLSQARVTTFQSAELEWFLPQQLAGQTSAVLRARGDGAAEIRVTLAAAELRSLHAELRDPQLRADGRSATVVRVAALDAFGNPVPGLQLTARAQGSVDAFAELTPGHYEAQYRAPIAGKSEDRVVVRDDRTGVSAEQTLALSARDGPVSLGARAGYLTNFARVSGPLALLQLAYRLPLLNERMRLSALAGYYQSHAGVAADGSAESLAVALWAMPVLLRVEYTFSFGAFDLTPLIGAGVLSAASRVAAAATGSYRDRHLTPLMAAGANTALAWGPGRVCFELGYWLASLDAAAISGNAGGANVGVGYELPL